MATVTISPTHTISLSPQLLATCALNVLAGADANCIAKRAQCAADAAALVWALCSSARRADLGLDDVDGLKL